MPPILTPSDCGGGGGGGTDITIVGPVGPGDSGDAVRVVQSEPVEVVQNDSVVDAFGRLRVSQPETVFDSKILWGADDLLVWQQLTTGGGVTFTASAPRASVTIGVSNLTGGLGIRTTTRRFNYEPGKSQLVLATFVFGAPAAGITREIGLTDTLDGFTLAQVGTAAPVFRYRTSTSGASVITDVSQAAWNLDPLDGTGPSGITLDLTRAQILVIDAQWLGAGRVRMGFDIGGSIVYCHEFLFANSLTVVYAKQLNLPILGSVANNASGPAATLEMICCAVHSEGGQQTKGKTFSINNGVTPVATAATATVYALLAFRLKTAYESATVLPHAMSIVVTTPSDLILWELRLNPTVAGVFTYTDVTSSACQRATGTVLNTVTGGITVRSGYTNTATAATAIQFDFNTPLALGYPVAGSDQYVLCGRPVNSATDVLASVAWKELT